MLPSIKQHFKRIWGSLTESCLPPLVWSTTARAENSNSGSSAGALGSGVYAGTSLKSSKQVVRERCMYLESSVFLNLSLPLYITLSRVTGRQPEVIHTLAHGKLNSDGHTLLEN